MASTIQIKRSSNTATPNANTLQPGELAYSYASNTLFIGDTANGVISVAVANAAAAVNAAYGQANAAYAQANAAFAEANTANAQANLAYAEANAAYALANTANNTAAAALPASGGTITGSLVVTQNLTVNGVVTMTIDGGSF